jgi:hypothetical protein
MNHARESSRILAGLLRSEDGAMEIRPAEVVPTTPAGGVQPVEPATTVTLEPGCTPAPAEFLQGAASPALAPVERRDSFEPLTSDLRRLHMTVSKQFLDKLESARKGQGHAQPGATAEKVREAALDLLLARQAKRRAEVKTPQQNPRPARNPCHVTAAAKRAVWARDEGTRQWRLDSGGICGSTLRLEIDHVPPRARCTATTGWTDSPNVKQWTPRSRGKPRRGGLPTFQRLGPA